jgi:hypothetical protein
MTQMAFCVPILPGKSEEWKQFIQEIQGPRYNEFRASRDKVGVYERSYHQSTPMGDILIVTLEGDDPMGSFQRMASSKDPFTTWFVQQVKEIHGIDLSQPLPGSMPDLVIDSKQQQMHRRAA